MTMNGKRDNFTIDDFKTCAKAASMKRGRAESIISEVLDIVSRWKEYANDAGVPVVTQGKIRRALRLDGFK
jgi:serine/threonine-protein kinase HipA